MAVELTGKCVPKEAWYRTITFSSFRPAADASPRRTPVHRQ